MNWVDLIIILLLGLFALEGLHRSFFGELLDFLSFLLALFASLRFYNPIANFLSSQFNIPHSLGNVLGFFIVWVITELILAISIRLLIAKLPVLNHLDSKLQFLSVLPASLRGVIFVAILLVLIAAFPIQPQIKTAVKSSKIGAYILNQTYRFEAPFKNIFGGITDDTLSFLTVEPKTNESLSLGFKTTHFTERTDLEQQMIGLVNHERTSRGIHPLTFDNTLRQVAYDHSADMLERGYFSHYSPEGTSVADRAAKYHVNYLVIGENLAYAPSLMLAHNGLMNSPGHRANILSNDYNKIGIAVLDAGDYGLMITQDFTN